MGIRLEVPITVADADDKLDDGYDSIKVRRSTDGGSTYSLLTTTAYDRIDLESGETGYTYEDPDAEVTYLYQWAVYRASDDTTDAYTPSAGQSPTPDPHLAVISIDELKSHYLFGIDLTDDSGNPYSDSTYQHYIRSAVDSLETSLSIDILDTTWQSEPHDFYRDEYNKFIWLEPYHRPIIEVVSVKLYFPAQVLVQDYPREWINVRRHEGQIQLMPGSGSAGQILLGAAGTYLPLISSAKFIPDRFEITYRAGFGKPTAGSYDRSQGAYPQGHPVSRRDPKLDRVPPVIKDLVGKLAALGPLNIAGDLLGGAGIASQSVSIDGISQSFNTTSSATNAGYGARVTQYIKELKEQIPRVRNYYNGAKLAII